MSAKHTPGIICEFVCRRQVVRFFVSNLGDTVQNRHFNGGFYEAEELSIIEAHLKPGGVFLDLGANVGNHAVFVAKFCRPGTVILIEPNPEALRHLRANLLLNRLDLDVSHLGLGLSDLAESADVAWQPNNLGGARMTARAGGAIQLVTGDSLLADRCIDFMKIDIEGHEIKALNGLERTIAASRPKIFVEVDDENRPAFEAWRAAHDYTTLKTFRRYRINENVLIAPNETLEAAGLAAGSKPA